MKVYYKRLPVSDMSIKFVFKSEYEDDWHNGTISQKEIMDNTSGCVECLVEKIVKKVYQEKLDLEDLT